MAIRFECEQCGSVLKIKDDLAGKPGKCPKCKTAFTVPAPEDTSNSSGEIAAIQGSDDAEPMLAPPKAGSANDDFDLDAFLLDDGEADSKTTPTRPSKPRRSDERSDDSESGPSGQSKTANKAEEGEGFSISRGPDALGKRVKHHSLPAQEDDEVDEPPTPSRRPPGTNPNAPASNVASDLLSKTAKKGNRTSWTDIGSEKREEDQFDWEGFSREVLKKGLPLVVLGIVLVWGLFKVVNSSMGSKAFAPPLGQVTGTLTINAKPLAGAEIWFHPEKPKIKSGDKEYKVTASVGMTDATGHYELTYVGDLKGAVVGTCRVQIMAPGRQDVAPQYLGDKSTATQTVKKGKQIIDLELSK